MSPGPGPGDTSWVGAAQGSDFPLQAMPYGVFSRPGEEPRVGVAIGDRILDLAALGWAGLLDDACPGAGEVFAAAELNPFLARGRPVWRAVRHRLARLLVEGGDRSARPVVEGALVERAGATLHLPVAVADYVDFYSSLDHATNMGRMFRPEGEALLPNWRHLPVGYHGRAGTVVVSGTPLRRPIGLRRTPEGAVVAGPSVRLDIELEVGFVVGAGSVPGRPVSPRHVADHVFGCVLVNDWSARDIQAFEYQPLGPFLGKSFATSVSAWVLPLDALEAARRPGPPQDPLPQPHLRRHGSWGLDLSLEVWLRPAGSPEEERLARVGFAGMYWTIDQQVAHLTSNGAHLRVGDLLASGTVSGPGPTERGSLIELCWNATAPLELRHGARRTFLEDGDEVVLRGSTTAGGVRLTLGEVRGSVQPSVAGVS